MEAIKMLHAVGQLRTHYDKPHFSDIEIANIAILKQLASIHKIEMPMILDEEKREKFMSKIELLESFLESERGKAAIEFLTNAWDTHCEELDSIVQVEPVDQEEETEEDE